VVETDGVTWLLLATERVSWADALSDGRLHASGNRTDLTAFFPLTGAASGPAARAGD
jgi:hypothetical protein